ncbi:hypothetical protein QYE76_045796 [Lolium multiflorum]|uniref:Uncharacterized protein n=1 Tax=Lolium multiflorum TaxID=4521 RepID=A0AAD8X0G8_LOLMU|nr:hypothetical protein QYE76_045796 [Lolium multiflorum]
MATKMVAQLAMAIVILATATCDCSPVRFEGGHEFNFRGETATLYSKHGCASTPPGVPRHPSLRRLRLAQHPHRLLSVIAPPAYTPTSTTYSLCCLS